MAEEQKIHILFLCTANACRSQMAEGWSEKLKDNIEAFSAGVRPAFRVSKNTVKIMAEAGVDISDYTPKHLKDLQGIKFDFVVTLCDSASRLCPSFPGNTKIIHHSFEDPTEFIGTPEQTLNKFRQIRDSIKTFIETLPKSLKQE